MTRKVALAAGVLFSVLATGCLRTEKAHTLYLEPDGTLTWMAVEKDVYSDERDPGKRAGEELEYLALAQAGEHPVARGFRLLDPLDVTVRIVRDRRPYVVVTTARFASLQEVMLQAIARADLDASSHLESEGGRVTWTFTIRSGEARNQDAADALTPLFDEPWRIVLAHGRFVAAQGFRLEHDGHLAIMLDDDDADPEPAHPVVRSLSWEVAER
jgi:hypothetical protein